LLGAKGQEDRGICRTFNTFFPPAVPALRGDEIATSRGIFVPYFSAPTNCLPMLANGLNSPSLAYRLPALT